MKAISILQISIIFLIGASKGFASQDCISIKEIHPPTGTICHTSKGGVFVRFNKEWIDAGANGKTWHDDMAADIDQYEAEIFCSDRNLTLPSIEDLQVAYHHGFTELKSMQNSWFWSSDKSNPNNKDLGKILDAHGATYTNSRSGRASFIITRCISEQKED